MDNPILKSMKANRWPERTIRYECSDGECYDTKLEAQISEAEVQAEAYLADNGIELNLSSKNLTRLTSYMRDHREVYRTLVNLVEAIDHLVDQHNMNPGEE